MKWMLYFFIPSLFISSFHTKEQRFDKPVDYNNYEKSWREIEEFEKKGLTQSAYDAVQKIYQRAKREDNAPQIIKAYLYESKYAMKIRENSELIVVNRLKREIQLSNFPTKPILQSILGNLYWQYFQANSYKFLNRTKLQNAQSLSGDFRTWSLRELLSESHKLFGRSLKNSKKVERIHLSDFNAILSKHKNTLFTLSVYDFLALQALNFYVDSKSSLTKPKNTFLFNQKEAFAPLNEFLDFNFPTRDSLSSEWNTLELFQKLLRSPGGESSQSRIIEFDRKRLEFAYIYSIVEEKEELYRRALKRLIEKYPNHSSRSDLNYDLAKWYRNQGNKYDFNNGDRYKNDLKTAVDICRKAIKKFPKAIGAKNCKGLLDNILSPSLQIRLEEYLPINLASPFLLEYRNVPKIYFKLMHLDEKQWKDLKINQYRNRKDVFNAFKNKKALEKWSYSLKETEDHQNHSSIGKIPPVDGGQYLLLFSSDKNFDSKKSSYGYYSFQSTDLALSIKANSKETVLLKIQNRKNGTPIQSVKIQPFYTRNYSRGKILGGGLNVQYGKKIITNSKGEASFEFLSKRYFFNAKVEHQQDKAWFYSNSSHYQNNSPRPVKKSYIFTDRSIYRPGQIVYFKGILIESKGNDYHVLSNYDTEVVFRDANYQEIARQKVQTNEYGSYRGSFVIPNGRLLGRMSIYDKFGNQSISVEEYKRPKFKVVFEELKKEVFLNDRVVVHGRAKSYSGTPITNAKVSYRVVRKAEFPYRYYSWSIPPITNKGEMEIARGITKTNAIGSFKIPFDAIPDLSISKESKPIFNYKIIAEVTDINGETQSRETFTKVGYQSLLLDLEMRSKWKLNQKETITIVTKNLNGTLIRAKGKLSLRPLKKQNRIIRKSHWSKVDQSLWKEEEFIKHFPHDAYSKEDQPQNREIEKRVWKSDFDTGKNTKFQINTSPKWREGTYVLIATVVGSKGEKIEIKKFISLQSDKSIKLSEPKALEVLLYKDNLQPGDSALIRVGTSMPSLQFDYEIYSTKEKIGFGSFVLNNEIKSINIPIEEKHRGRIRFVYHAIGLNRDLSGYKDILVPFTNKELSIRTEVFRDKLRSGSKESWRLSLQGLKKDEIAAEVLVGMYDASLDALAPHNWTLNLYKNFYFKTYNPWRSQGFNVSYAKIYYPKRNPYEEINIYLPKLKWFGFGFYRKHRNTYRELMAGSAMPGSAMPGIETTQEFSELENLEEYNDKIVEKAPSKDYSKQSNRFKLSDKIIIRKNFQETAFFFPQLRTDEKGTISFSFEVPEALTQWKFMVLGHTKELAVGKLEREVVTQKELMVFPNLPRFVRQGDEMTISSKISNLYDKYLSGSIELKVFDALTRKPLNKAFNIESKKNFQLQKEGNTSAEWKMRIPRDIYAIIVQVVAKSGTFSDGEEQAIPVLSNRKLVTETLPFWISGIGAKHFRLDRVKNPKSSTLQPHRLTLELTSNPAWLAVQSLPYIMEYPYKSLDNVFSRFYANSIATHLANSNPKIKRVFESWRNTDALESNLEKNKELKQIILQESPWVQEAQSEEQQRRRIGQLFDLNQMKNDLQKAIKELEENQFSSGAWPWFEGGMENITITEYIVSGFGHLNTLGVSYQSKKSKINGMTTKAIEYLDNELGKSYQRLIDKKIDLEKYQIGYSKIHYFYARSFFKDIEIKREIQVAYNYFYKKLKKNWHEKTLSSQAMIALIHYRNGDISTAKSIVKSLRENSIQNEELGMYWKENKGGYRWRDAAIQTQSLLIEAFDEIVKDSHSVNQMKIWLLKNKQTNRWRTTKATVNACYSLISKGSDWLGLDKSTELVLGSENIRPKGVEAGTGYFKTAWQKGEIKPEYADVKIKKKNKGIAWGALYYQYFEDLDEIETSETPLKLKKTVFVQKNTSKGPVLREITENNPIKIGDLVKVKIELRVDRDMEFIHLKDMRASGLEPIQSLSGYRWQGVLGYYQSTKDASTNFFFDRIKKGIYVFEYSLRANVAGVFSNGNASIQSMYAPEFSSHSNGLRLTINAK